MNNKKILLEVDKRIGEEAGDMDKFMFYSSFILILISNSKILFGVCILGIVLSKMLTIAACKYQVKNLMLINSKSYDIELCKKYDKKTNLYGNIVDYLNLFNCITYFIGLSLYILNFLI